MGNILGGCCSFKDGSGSEADGAYEERRSSGHPSFNELPEFDVDFENRDEERKSSDRDDRYDRDDDIDREGYHDRYDDRDESFDVGFKHREEPGVGFDEESDKHERYDDRYDRDNRVDDIDRGGYHDRNDGRDESYFD